MMSKPSDQATPFPLRSNSAWSMDGIRRFLDATRIPLRMALESSRNPLIVSLWFELRDDAIWCVAHRDALAVKLIGQDPACAMDISTNEIPYRGVRGAGTVCCLPDAGAETLDRLIQRYLGSDANRLARWLKSRQDEEVALKITPNWLTSWDFSSRMSDIDNAPTVATGPAATGRTAAE